MLVETQCLLICLLLYGIVHKQHKWIFFFQSLAEQQRQLEDTKTAIREQVEQGMLYDPYMDGGMLPYTMQGPMGFGSTSGNGQFAILTDIDNHPHWYPYLQVRDFIRIFETLNI